MLLKPAGRLHQSVCRETLTARADHIEQGSPYDPARGVRHEWTKMKLLGVEGGKWSGSREWRVRAGFGQGNAQNVQSGIVWSSAFSSAVTGHDDAASEQGECRITSILAGLSEASEDPRTCPRQDLLYRAARIQSSC